MSFFQGFLEGYNTLDAVASLVFGIILVNSVRSLGVESPKNISASVLKAGVLSTLLMAAIYCILTVLGAQSRGVVGISADGGEALYQIGSHYFGTFGGILLGCIVTFACLKTAIGLVTSCATAFVDLFPNTLSYRGYAIVFSLFSFGIANFGLSRIIELSLPALMFLYPLTITLILLCLFGRFFDYDRRVFISVTAFTFIPAVVDFINTLPAGAKNAIHADKIIAAVDWLPLFSIGMSWVVPSIVGLAIGVALHLNAKKA